MDNKVDLEISIVCPFLCRKSSLDLDLDPDLELLTLDRLVDLDRFVYLLFIFLSDLSVKDRRIGSQITVDGDYLLV